MHVFSVLLFLFLFSDFSDFSSVMSFAVDISFATLKQTSMHVKQELQHQTDANAAYPINPMTV